MRQGIIAVAALAVIMLGGNVLLRWGRREPSPAEAPVTDGPLVIRPPRRNAILFGITALIPAVLLGSVTLTWWRLGHMGAAGLATGVAASVLIAAFAVYQFASAARARMIVHDTGIERVGVFRRRVVGWSTIAKIDFNPAHHWFFLTLTDRSHLWLPADVGGMPEFATIARRRLPPAVLQADPLVREVLDDLAGAARTTSSAR
jgi:hypothetical protein